MRIDLYNSAATQIASEQTSQQVTTPNAASSGHADSEDRATLTSDSTSVGALASTALRSPEIRHDKVAALQQAIGSGQYELDPGKIAASMVDDHA